MVVVGGQEGFSPTQYANGTHNLYTKLSETTEQSVLRTIGVVTKVIRAVEHHREASPRRSD